MTSQVAVANHGGVAVASDTVVTSYVQGGTKTVGNSRKIWEIGPAHKVLILHSGSVTQNGVMVNLLLSEWASTLSGPLEKLEDYVDAYITWMNREKSIHTQDSEFRRANYLLNDHYYEVKKRAESKWMLIPVEEEHLTSREEILLNYAQDGLEYLKSLDLNPGVSNDSEFEKLIQHDAIDLDEKFNVIFGDIGLNDENKNILIQSAPLILSRAQNFPYTATLAFVGFGSKEYFAGNIRLNSIGFYGGKFIYDKGELFSVDPDAGSTISAFAQDEAIQGFIRGARWEIIDQVESLIEEKVNEFIEVDDPDKNLGEDVATAVRKALQEFNFERYTKPLLDSIEGLDLSHLANLAESLVGMQATASFGGDNPATVGGFVEVATIDRQHGVVWVNSL